MKKVLLTLVFTSLVLFSGYSQITIDIPCEGGMVRYYHDNDSDGYGDSNDSICVCLEEDNDCIGFAFPDGPPSGYVTIGGDCDDNDSTVHAILRWYPDNDGDNLGDNFAEAVYSCGAPFPNAVTNNSDCDDNDANVGILINRYYADGDGDGYGDPFDFLVNQCTPPEGYVLNGDDLCPDVYGIFSGCTYESMNWVTSKTYDVTGSIISSNKIYFDELGRQIQNQSVDILTGDTWASQTMYDNTGRAALHSLSAPIDTPQNEAFIYKTNFIRKTNGQTYEVSDFENNTEAPEPIGDQSGSLGWYYSQSNNSEAYQDITDYPFSRTIYSDLNPGSALITIGGNKVDHDGDGSEEWINGFTYTVPVSQEMHYVFGKNYFDSDGNTNNAHEVVTKFYKTVSIDVHGVESVVFTDGEGKALAAARSGGTTKYEVVAVIGEQHYVDVHIPKGIVSGDIQYLGNSSQYKIYNLRTEEIVSTSQITGGNFYRIEYIGTSTIDYDNPSISGSNITTTTNTKGIRYKVNYYDYALNYYDEAGRLVRSTQPLGFNTAAFNLGTGLPSHEMATTYTYNALGQLLETTSPDEGTANFIYREDGQIRFSQNSKQAPNREFSYTNYDDLARPIESGVYTDEEVNFSTLSATYNLDPEYCSEQHFTIYDEADLENLHNALESEGIETEYYRNQNFVAGNVSKTYTNNPATSTTWYSYDVYGRVEWLVQDIEHLGTKTIDYEYDAVTGLVTKVIYQKHKSNELFAHSYDYNSVGQLMRVMTSTNDDEYKLQALYEYYETGALKRTLVYPVDQGVDYVYNLAGQLKAINHPSLLSSNDPGGDNNDAFGMHIDYYNGDYKRANTPTPIVTSTGGENRYDGNIKATRWATAAIDGSSAEVQNAYQYKYNNNKWLEDATYGSALNNGTITPNSNNNYKVSNLSYDANGNLLSLARNSDDEEENAMDKFTYEYNVQTNQLNFVHDDIDPSEYDDLDSQEDDNYVYNTIGQLTKDNSSRINYVYNASGLVTRIHTDDNKFIMNIFYDDRGHRVRKETSYSGGDSWRITFYVRDASGSVMAIYAGAYEDEIEEGLELARPEHPIYGASRLGMYNRTTGVSQYQFTDHLGNVRAVLEDEDQEVTNFTDYYPFGMPMPNRNVVGDYRYAYQGQEKDAETGKEAFTLRLWDSRIGRWLTTDPMGEFHSPYLGMGNNPISKIDPTGGSTAGPTDEWRINADGSKTWLSNRGGDEVQYLHFGEGTGLEGYTAIALGSFEEAGFWDYASKSFYGALELASKGGIELEFAELLETSSVGIGTGIDYSGSNDWQNNRIDQYYNDRNSYMTGEVFNSHPITMQNIGGNVQGLQENNIVFDIMAGGGTAKILVSKAKVPFFKALGQGIKTYAPALGRGRGVRIGISTSRGRQVFRVTRGNNKTHLLDIDLGKIPKF